MPSPNLLDATDLGKCYGPTWVLKNVNLKLQSGQVLALLGENGAGKSTFVKILSGAVQPDRGTVHLNGQALPLGNPGAIRQAGISIVYQELSVCPDLSVEDNIMLGCEWSQWGFLKRQSQRQKIQEVLHRLGHPDLEPQRKVGTLSTGAQQLVEIARALASDAKVIVLDEPTSSLAQADVARLFTVIRDLRSQGLGIIYISHFLEEIQQLCDSYCVLRDGEVAGQGALYETTESEIVKLMVGREVEELFPHVEHRPEEIYLNNLQLFGRGLTRPVDLAVRKGEIFGIAGLVGSGRTELLQLMYGLQPAQSGTVVMTDRPLRGGPWQRIRRGLGMLSEDRKGSGLAQSMSVRDNLTLSRLAPYQRWGVLDEKQREARVQHWIDQVSIKTNDTHTPVSQLSGGNQQKVAFARLLHQDAEVLLLDEPTRGIDVGTKAEIYRLMGRLAAEGKTILFVSSYFKELLELCDRIGLMVRGELVAVRPANAWTEAELMHMAMRGAV